MGNVEYGDIYILFDLIFDLDFRDKNNLKASFTLLSSFPFRSFMGGA